MADNHIVPEFPELAFTIYPLREVTLDNFVYTLNKPLTDVTTGTENMDLAVPLLLDYVEDVLSIGYRGFTNFSSRIPIRTTSDLQELLVRLSTAESTELDVENIIREEYNTGLLKVEEVLDEQSFDCDNPLDGFSSLDCLEYSELRPKPKQEDLKFITNFYEVKDEDGDGFFTATFTKSGSFKKVKVRTNIRRYKKTEGSILSVKYTSYVLVRYEEIPSGSGGGSLTLTNKAKNILRNLYQVLSKTDFRKGGGFMGEIESGIKLSRRSFSFKSETVPFSKLEPLRSAIGHNNYGVLIHEKGVSPTKTIKKDTGTITIADFTKCFSYGSINLKQLNSGSDSLDFMGELTILPSKPDSMDKLKFDNVVVNHDFASGIADWSGANVTLSHITVPEGKLSVEFTAAPLGSVTGDIDTGSYTRINAGSRVYIELDIDEFDSTLDTILLYVNNTAMGQPEILVVKISSAGQYNLVSDVLDSDIDWTDVELVFTPTDSNNGTVIFNSIKLGECSRGNYS